MTKQMALVYCICMNVIFPRQMTLLPAQAEDIHLIKVFIFLWMVQDKEEVNIFKRFS